jgi:hypothetical protein
MDVIHFDYSKLQTLLTVLKTRSEEHDSTFYEVKHHQQLQADTSTRHSQEIASLNEQTASFKEGLHTLHDMSDKVDAWGERFRYLEERNYKMYKDLNEMSVTLQGQIDELRSGVQLSNSEIVTSLQAEIARKQGESEKSMATRCRTIEDELETLKLESKIGAERIQRDFSERVNGFYDFIGVTGSQPAPSSSQADIKDLASQTSGESVRSNPLKAIAMKIANLERKVYVQPDLERPDLSDPRAQQDVMYELNHRFAFLSREVDSMKTLISIVQGAPQEGKLSVKENYLSLMDRISDLSKLREAMPALLSLETRVYNLTETMTELSEKAKANEAAPPAVVPRELNKYSAMIVTQAIETSKIVEVAPSELLPKAEEKKQVETKALIAPVVDLEPYNRRLQEVADSLNRVLKTLRQKADLADLEDLHVQLKNIAKRSVREGTTANVEESSGKLDDFENRLNKLWKQNLDLGNLIHQFTAQLTRSSQETLEKQETKLEVLTVQVNSAQKELNKQLEAVAKNVSALAEEFGAKESSSTEQYLKTQILGLKRGLQETEERVEAMHALVAAQTQILADDAGDMEEISSLEHLSSLQKFQAILNHHDKAIRILANRANMEHIVEETKTMKLDANEVVEHLEDLRIEMHEMQVKYDLNKTLSAKEIEKLSEIYSLLSTKSDKQELGRKVDKSELKRLERLLRKQIDKVNETLKKSEEGLQHPREDAFFLKKKLDVDCASCGQMLPNYHDHALHFTPKERFPARSALFGTGFSRLLASLVPNESGGMTLPSKLAQNTSNPDLRSVVSPPAQSVRVTTSTKRRLPKLSKGS